MRVVIADPPSYTRPYDHHLCAALAARGAAVDLLASPHAFDSTAPADELPYRLDEVAFPLSGRAFRARPRSRGRAALKAVEYVPSVALMLRAIGVFDPDVVHFQWLPRPRTDGRWLRRLATRRPLVFTAHDLGALGRAPKPFWRELLPLFRRIVVHSQRGAESLEAFGVPRERIAVVSHPAFEATNGYVPGAPQGKTLLFFGLIRDYKGLDVLVRALPDVPEARLVVADPVDPVEPLRTLAHDLGVDGRIDWRLGYVPATEVAGLMADATAVVLPYRRLDASGVLATALGHGRPVVVTDVGALGEQVREHGAGRVVAAGDSAELAAALNELLLPAELERAAAGAAAAARALTWDAAAEAHERLYAEVAG
jgi:glycosyltransferase involved in cell wall biosynthesis